MTAIEEAQTTPHLNNQRKKDQIMKTFKATLIAMVMISALGLAQPVTANAQDSQTTSLVGKGGLCLDVPYADASNGTDLWMWDCNQSEAQSFTYDAAAKELRVLGKCLDIEGRERSGSDVQITLCGYTGNLNWYATVQGEIRTEKFPDLCLDIRGGKATRKTAVQMWTCNGTAAQRWNLDTDTAVADSPAVSQGPLHRLLDEIAEGEGTSDADAQKRGYASGYDVPLGYGRFTKNLPSHLRIPISTMTIAQVRELQDIIRPRSKMNSSAVGRYQIVGKTLDGLQAKLGLPDSTVFDKSMQDELAVVLLNRRGMDDYLAGSMTAPKFQVGLAKEWASIARDASGLGYYSKPHHAKAATTNTEIDRAIAALKK